MVYKFLIPEIQGSGVNNKIKQIEQLAKELHKPIIRKLKERTIYSS